MFVGIVCKALSFFSVLGKVFGSFVEGLGRRVKAIKKTKQTQETTLQPISKPKSTCGQRGVAEDPSPSVVVPYFFPSFARTLQSPYFFLLRTPGPNPLKGIINHPATAYRDETLRHRSSSKLIAHGMVGRSTSRMIAVDKHEPLDPVGIPM